jgi:hypothetical protein
VFGIVVIEGFVDHADDDGADLFFLALVLAEHRDQGAGFW